jgi:hypothetical protein
MVHKTQTTAKGTELTLRVLHWGLVILLLFTLVAHLVLS